MIWGCSAVSMITAETRLAAQRMAFTPAYLSSATDNHSLMELHWDLPLRTICSMHPSCYDPSEQIHPRFFNGRTPALVTKEASQPQLSFFFLLSHTSIEWLKYHLRLPFGRLRPVSITSTRSAAMSTSKTSRSHPPNVIPQPIIRCLWRPFLTRRASVQQDTATTLLHRMATMLRLRSAVRCMSGLFYQQRATLTQPS